MNDTGTGIDAILGPFLIETGLYLPARVIYILLLRINNNIYILRRDRLLSCVKMETDGTGTGK